MAAAVEEETERHGYAVMMASIRGVAERELFTFRPLDDQHADGLMLMTNRPGDGALAARIGANSHSVLVDERVPLADLETLTLIYERFLEDWFSVAASASGAGSPAGAEGQERP